MKIALKLISILIVLALSASCKEAELVIEERLEPQQEQVIPPKETAKPALGTFGDTTVRQVEVREVVQAGSYTYLKVKEDQDLYWIAIIKDRLEVGDKFSFAGAAKMENFRSRELQKTFDVVYFLGGISKKDTPATEGHLTVAPKETIISAIDPIPNTSVHEVKVLEVEHANSYTYLKVKEDQAVYWIAIIKREIEIGEEFSFGHTLRMEAFKSKNLKKTFADIYFVERISLEDQAATKAQPTAVAGHENITAENISVAPAQGGVSIGELFANRTDYADKTVRVRGQVTKFRKNIMGTNWVHLQDGTGQAGTDDLTVTTDQTAAFGEVVTFEGTIILNKDFGAGYSYEVIMQKAKRVE